VIRPLVLAAVTAVAATALLVPASPSLACSAPQAPENPSGYCENPTPEGQSPRPAPSPSECTRLVIRTYQPGYPAAGLDQEVKQNVDVFAVAGSTVTLTGYERPSTEVRTFGTRTTNYEGFVRFPVRLQGSARLFATSDAEVCAGRTATAVAVVQARLGGLTAHRSAPRDYSFTTFYAGPAGKVGNLYRVLPDGREVLTAQTRLGGEWATIRRTFTGSGRFGFVLRTRDDAGSLGTSTNVRDTVIH
jgi:hypothetical protein